MSTTRPTPQIQGLHHNAYRCRDSEETRRFYEDFLELPLAATLEIRESKTGRSVNALHTFYRMADGSFLAFFEVPHSPFEFADRHDYDLHIALEVERPYMMTMLEKGRRLGLETRGVADHDFIHSIYFRDPNGYVIELTTPTDTHEAKTDPDRNDARALLDRWQADKSSAP